MDIADPDPSGSYIWQIVLLIILIAVNAFFAMAEMAMVSVNRNTVKRLADEGNRKAIILQGLLDRPNKFLSTIQVCITLAGFLQSASAATSMAGDLGVWLAERGVGYGLQLAIVIITLILSFINLVFGELVPKRVALQSPDRIALFMARPVSFVAVFFKPFVWLLSATVSAILRPFGVKKDSIDLVYSEDDIKSHLEVGIENGHLDEDSMEMITSVFEFDDKLAYEIMTPRTDVYMKGVNDKLADYVDELLHSRHSRIPYYGANGDDILGVLYIKDFIIQAKKVGWTRVNIKKLLQKPLFVPESKKIDELFHEMQDSKINIAFLVDEYGGMSGIVTTEDLIEEVMGAIDDEGEDTEPKMEKLEDGDYLIDGNYYLDDLNEALGLSYESDDYETIGGYLIDELGEIPGDGDEGPKVIEDGRCVFTIESWKERRIDKVRLRIVGSPDRGVAGQDAANQP
ncbi:MAG: hemolysin family protein [Clostridiales Family XIII bacterium]|jgi:putative hemolysin|nr:hemolysin family protein [Clostridiales Family XIII bacterium]